MTSKNKSPFAQTDQKVNTNQGGAFIITNEDETILATGFNPDTAHNWFSCSYRSEAQACVAVFLFIKHFCAYLHLTLPEIIYYCDNLGLIKN